MVWKGMGEPMISQCGKVRLGAAPFLLTNPDFSKTEVVKAYDHTVVVPAIDYWKRTIEVRKGAQVERIVSSTAHDNFSVLGVIQE